MLDLISAPAAVIKLVSWLHDNGYEPREERSSDSNNQYVLYSKMDQLVKIMASGGEWSLGIGMWGKTFHPEQWEAWLDSYSLAGELADLDRQVEFITQRWEAAVQQAEERPGAEAEIAELGDDWVQRRFGFRPPKPKP